MCGTGRAYTLEDIQEIEKSAIAHLKSIISRGLSQEELAIVQAKKGTEDIQRRLNTLLHAHGDKIYRWIKLLSSSEAGVLNLRWFYSLSLRGGSSDTLKTPLRTLANIFVGTQDSVARKGNRNIAKWQQADIAEGASIEQNAVRKLEEFANGNFSEADYRRVVRKYVAQYPEPAVRFADTIKNPFLKAVFVKRILKRKAMRTKSGNTTSAPFMQISAIAKRWQRRLGVEYEEAYQQVCDAELESARRFALFMEDTLSKHSV